MQCINWPEKKNILSKIPCLKKIIKFPRKTYTEDFSLKIDSNVPNFQTKEQIYRKKSGHFSSNSGDWKPQKSLQPSEVCNQLSEDLAKLAISKHESLKILRILPFFSPYCNLRQNTGNWGQKKLEIWRIIPKNKRILWQQICICVTLWQNFIEKKLPSCSVAGIRSQEFKDESVKLAEYCRTLAASTHVCLNN